MLPKLIRPKRFGDERGWFAESYQAPRYASLGVADHFVQDNHSYSRDVGVLRGLHFQRPPHAQAKLVRCVRGRIWDVAVDVRRGSPTFGRWVACELDPGTGLQLYIPIGFAHGFVTLEPETELEYKASDLYAPDCEDGIAWDDPDIAIPWPLDGAPILSARDQKMPRLAEFPSPFGYDGAPLAALEVPAG